jgi:GTP-binding protein HflX
LFATLDTTTRQMHVEQAGRGVAISDTVGFIRDLPHKLVEAFEATLQEAAQADLLLHVVDAASPNRGEQLDEVRRVLESIGAADIPQLLVFNKVDKLEPDQMPREAVDAIMQADGRTLTRVFVSAIGGQGLDSLRQLICDACLEENSASSPKSFSQTLNLPTSIDDGDNDTLSAFNGVHTLTA